MKRALGPALSIRQIMGSLSPQLNAFAELQNSGAFGLAEQARRLGLEHFMTTNILMSSQRLSAVAQSAAAMSLYNTEKFGRIRNLSHSFEGGIFGTAKALQGNTAILAAAMGASKLQDQWKAMMGPLSPNLFALRNTAASAILLDNDMLRSAGARIPASIARIVAEQAAEAQRIAEALTLADSPEESAELFVAFVTVIANIFGQLKENTVDELRRLGLVSLLLIALSIMELPQLLTNPKMSQDEQQAYSELQEKVDKLQVGLREIVEAEGALTEEYVSSLSRAELIRNANIRSAPSRSSPLILRAVAGTPIAISLRKGRWNLVVFRDPLTDQLSQGWVYESQIDRVDD